MSGEKIGMKVREKDVANLYAESFCLVQILLDVPLRINNDGRCAGFIGYQIGCVGEATQIILLEKHAPDCRSGGEMPVG